MPMTSYTDTARDLARELSAEDLIELFEIAPDENGNPNIARLSCHDGREVYVHTEQDDDGGESFTFTIYEGGEDVQTDGGPIGQAKAALTEAVS